MKETNTNDKTTKIKGIYDELLTKISKLTAEAEAEIEQINKNV